MSDMTTLASRGVTLTPGNTLSIDTTKSASLQIDPALTVASTGTQKTIAPTAGNKLTLTDRVYTTAE
jgi:hypothetical protein